MGRINQSRGLQLQAWEYGRCLFNGLVDRFRDEYGMENPPPPALIIDELLTDFLQVELRFHALPSNRHAQTDWIDGKPVVTVNALINESPA